MKKDIQYLIKNLIFISLLLIFMTYCQSQSNQYSSAEKTWCRLIKAAKENDMADFEKCIDIVSWAQSYGYTAEEIESFEKLREVMDESQRAKFIQAGKRTMQFMAENTWVIISEKEEDADTRILEVFAKHDMSTMTWYFSKRDKGWFLNFPLTDMNY